MAVMRVPNCGYDTPVTEQPMGFDSVCSRNKLFFSSFRHPACISVKHSNQTRLAGFALSWKDRFRTAFFWKDQDLSNLECSE